MHHKKATKFFMPVYTQMNDDIYLPTFIVALGSGNSWFCKVTLKLSKSFISAICEAFTMTMQLIPVGCELLQ